MISRCTTGEDGRSRQSMGLAGWMVGLVLAILLCCAGLLGGRAHSADGERILVIHSDESYESAFAAEFGECVVPDYGSFAERYDGEVQVLAVILDLTCYYWWPENPLDVYVWSDDAGTPGGVLALVVGCDAFVSEWPHWTRNVVDLPAPICAGATWWVGYWGAWPGLPARFGVCADMNGPGGGSPMYKIAPGLEWPEGWQPVEVRWGPTAALGIGAEVDETPSPPISPTWGAIKNLYR